MRHRPQRATLHRAGLGVVALAVSAAGVYSAYLVVVGVLRGPRGSAPGIYWPALALIAAVAIVCGLVARHLLKRRTVARPVLEVLRARDRNQRRVRRPADRFCDAGCEVLGTANPPSHLSL